MDASEWVGRKVRITLGPMTGLKKRIVGTNCLGIYVMHRGIRCFVWDSDYDLLKEKKNGKRR